MVDELSKLGEEALFSPSSEDPLVASFFHKHCHQTEHSGLGAAQGSPSRTFPKDPEVVFRRPVEEMMTGKWKKKVTRGAS